MHGYFILMIITLCLLCTDTSAENENDTVQAVSSNWIPFSYEINDTIKGSAYEIATNVLTESNTEYSYSVLPWARAYRYGLTKKNILIVGVGRTTKREELFHWIGPVTQARRIFFYKLKTRKLAIKHLQDARNFNIAVERHSYFHDFLTANNFDEEKMHLVTRTKQLMLLAKSGRVELFLLDENSIDANSQSLDLNANIFEKAHFAFAVTDYMALSKTSSPHLVTKLRQTYHTLLERGDIQITPP